MPKIASTNKIPPDIIRAHEFSLLVALLLFYAIGSGASLFYPIGGSLYRSYNCSAC